MANPSVGLACKLFPVLLLLVPAAARAADVLSTLRPGHPRVMLLDDDVTRLKSLIQTDPTAKNYFAQIQAAGDKLLTAPVSQHVLIGPRLLFTSRAVLVRTSTLGLLYRLTGDRRYADRCRDEMLAAARFKDWNPSHFLDVAEMTNALGIGYDWTYDALTDGERAEIRHAIVTLGLNEGLKVYASSDKIPNAWHKRTNNWNQVCNGGLTVGALAVADEAPDIARQVIDDARASIPLAMSQFAPGGGCVEGPGYWSYATQFTVYYLASLQTALGTDFGFLASPGFAHTGDFHIQSLGPTGKTFNFADAHDGIGPAEQMFWLATAFHQPGYAAFERAIATSVTPFHLLWYTPEGTQKDVDDLEKSALFKRINVAFLRTGSGINASFVGFKGGDNSASHAHLDLGTFVYDALGVRWALDLGPDDYNLPGYFGNQRWNYYRMRTEGHNTLTIDGKNQDPKGTAKIIGFSPDARSAVVDLSKAYGKGIRAMRGVTLTKDGALLVQDDVFADRPVEVVWNLHTSAKIAISSDGREATLEQAGKKLTARVFEPGNARFAVAPSDLPPDAVSSVPTGKARQPGEKLVVRMPEKVQDSLTLLVMLIPDGAEGIEPQVQPLQNAAAAMPVKD